MAEGGLTGADGENGEVTMVKGGWRWWWHDRGDVDGYADDCERRQRARQSMR